MATAGTSQRTSRWREGVAQLIDPDVAEGQVEEQPSHDQARQELADPPHRCCGTTSAPVP